MDREPHLDERLFRNDIDPPFKEALINAIISPAYARALESAGQNADGVTGLRKETQNKYTRVVHGFEADYKEGTVFVWSTAYQKDNESLTMHAAQRIYDDIQAQGEEEPRVAFHDPMKVQESFEFFTHHQLTVGLSDRSVRLKTTMGYSIEGVEVNYAALAGSNDLDDAFENMYDEQELAEIIRTLINFELVNASEVGSFLEQF